MEAGPITVTTDVRMAPAEAFGLFTAGINQWWPTDRYAVTPNPVRVHFAVGRDGVITETATDGSQHVWAGVATWEPGARLSLDWHPGREPALAQRVHVTFTATANGTQVTVAHDGFEVLGAAADAERLRWADAWELALGFCFEQIANSA